MPYGCLIGDYEFDHSPQDVEVLAGMAQISAASHTPFFAAAAPTLMNMETWQELGNPRDLTKIFQTPEYAPWRSLRASEDARYLGLTRSVSRGGCIASISLPSGAAKRSLLPPIGTGGSSIST